jgi:hypothetical protein
MNKFPQHVIEKLGWYVYALQDPRSKRIFYIGKGMGNRVFAHANSLLSKNEIKISDKLDIISEIINSGQSVTAIIIRHQIASEKDAYAIESSLIDFCDFSDKNSINPIFQLTNIVKGHSYQELGLMTAENVIQLYHAPKCPTIKEKGILFKIPNLWLPDMNRQELYEATRGWWALSENRKNEAMLALSVHNGIIRAIYKIEHWEKRGKGDRGWKFGEKIRWGFVGQDISIGSPYQNKNVEHLFAKNSQNPVKYLNC